MDPYPWSSESSLLKPDRFVKYTYIFGDSSILCVAIGSDQFFGLNTFLIQKTHGVSLNLREATKTRGEGVGLRL